MEKQRGVTKEPYPFVTSVSMGKGPPHIITILIIDGGSTWGKTEGGDQGSLPLCYLCFNGKGTSPHHYNINEKGTEVQTLGH